MWSAVTPSQFTPLSVVRYKPPPGTPAKIILLSAKTDNEQVCSGKFKSTQFSPKSSVTKETITKSVEKEIETPEIDEEDVEEYDSDLDDDSDLDSDDEIQMKIKKLQDKQKEIKRAKEVEKELIPEDIKTQPL